MEGQVQGIRPKAKQFWDLEQILLQSDKCTYIPILTAAASGDVDAFWF